MFNAGLSGVNCNLLQEMCLTWDQGAAPRCQICLNMNSSALIFKCIHLFLNYLQLSSRTCQFSSGSMPSVLNKIRFLRILIKMMLVEWLWVVELLASCSCTWDETHQQCCRNHGSVWHGRELQYLTPAPLFYAETESIITPDRVSLSLVQVSCQEHILYHQ